MSSVSRIGGSAQSIYQFIQALSGNSSAASASSTSATSGTGATSTAQSIAQAAQSVGQAAQSIGQALHGHHHRHGALKQIQDAVTTALQSAQSSGSNSDPNKVIEDAIAQVLGGGSGAASATDGGDTDASAASTSPAINTQNFFQKLQAFGVTPQQFQQDLLLAMRDAQNGTVNSATAFQSFPLGSSLNVVG